MSVSNLPPRLRVVEAPPVRERARAIIEGHVDSLLGQSEESLLREIRETLRDHDRFADIDGPMTDTRVAYLAALAQAILERRAST